MTDYLIEITAWTGAAVETLYFSGGGYISGPSDTPANTYYAPRIINPGSIKVMLFSDGKTSGQSQVGYGEITFANADGGLDVWLDYGFDGRAIVVKKVVDGVQSVMMSCTAEQPAPSGNEMAIRIKDPQARLNVPIQNNKYGGTNSLPAGLDGVDDIKGNPKPLLFGKVPNATPVLVNTSKLIYQVNQGAAYNISAVYDKGVALTKGSNYASQADMEANQPAAGTYRAWATGGFFRLGSSPTGQITFDATETSTAADHTAAQIAKRIALRAIPYDDMVAANFTALDALNDAEVGIHITSETNIPAALDEVLGSIGGWCGFEGDAKFRVGRLDVPAGTPALSLTVVEIKIIERLATRDEGRGLPVSRVTVNYGKNYTVQSIDQLAGSVDLPRQQWLAKETRAVTDSDDSVKTAHLLATEITLNSLLVEEADAQAEATRQLDMRKVRRDYIAVQMPRSAIAGLPACGDIIHITYPRFGYDAGKLFVLIGYEQYLETDNLTLYLWG